MLTISFCAHSRGASRRVPVPVPIPVRSRTPAAYGLVGHLAHWAYGPHSGPCLNRSKQQVTTLAFKMQSTISGYFKTRAHIVTLCTT